MHKNVHDNRDKEHQDPSDREEERRTDEESGNATALGGGRGDAEGHDEGIGNGFEELHRRRSIVGGILAALIAGGILAAFETGNRDGTKVTPPMGSIDGARLGVSYAVQATETIADSNELKIFGLK